MPSLPSLDDTQDVHFIARSRPSARLRALNADTPTDSSSARSHIQQNVPRSVLDEKALPLPPLPPISPVFFNEVGETRVARRVDIIASPEKRSHRRHGSQLRVEEINVAVKLRRQGRQERNTENPHRGSEISRGSECGSSSNGKQCSARRPSNDSTPRRGLEIPRDVDSVSLSNGMNCPARRPINGHLATGVSRIEDLSLLSHIVSAGSIARRRRHRLDSASEKVGVLSSGEIG
jgi:hypothetical protein